MATFNDNVDTLGSLRALTGTASAKTKGIIITGVTGTGSVTITNAAHGQATTLTIPDVGAAAGFIAVDQSSSVALAPGAITRVITCGQAALASAGKVTVQAHTSATSQFVVIDVKVIKSTGLSGNSGDRLLALTDGTIVFNNAGITAAVLGTPVTTVWGGTGNPVPASTVGVTTTAGADLYLQYAGGTTDYNAGSVIVMVTLAQVTA